jgi:DNA-directed RNA polymerase specialized sigma24 family protein
MFVATVEETGDEGRVYYSRDRDGGHAVHVLPSGYKLMTPTGEQLFASKRQLLIAITGHPKARNWTFDRYFRLEAVGAVPAVTTLEWFRPVTEDHRPISGVLPGTEIHGSEEISISEAAALALKASSELSDSELELGIDLVSRSHEVAKLLFKGFGGWIYSSGYDPKEVLQEVFLGLLVRNRGKCPWDAEKSSFGHYVHMVCNGVLSNFHRKKKRIRQCEQTGVFGYDEAGDWKLQDVASANVAAATDGQLQRFEMLGVTEDLLEFMPKDSSTHLARRVLPYLRDGYTRTDIAKQLGVSRTLVMAATVELQGWARRWYAQ